MFLPSQLQQFEIEFQHTVIQNPVTTGLIVLYNRPKPGGVTRGAGWYDKRCTSIHRGSQKALKTVGQCSDICSKSSPGSPLEFRGQRPEISLLHRVFKLRPNSVERLDCATLDSHWLRSRKLPRQTHEDVVCIQPETAIPLGWISPHICQSGIKGLEDLPGYIQLLETVFGDPDQLVNTELKSYNI